MQEEDPSVTLPYWDSNLDYILGSELATMSVMWSENFAGDGNGVVRTGPFAYWDLVTPSFGESRLWRNLTFPPEGFRTPPSLMADTSIIDMFSASSLRELSWFVDTTFESNHGATHNWVGGVMGDLENSPGDPIFWLHHAFIDCLWQQFRVTQFLGTPSIDPRYDYPNDSEALGVGILQPDGVVLDVEQNSNHYSNGPMRPFEPLRNIDGLSSEYFNDFYTCEPSPICSEENTDCGSAFLFCDLTSYRCAPKLNLQAPCEDFALSSPCYNGVCCNNVCSTSCQQTDPPLPAQTVPTHVREETLGIQTERGEIDTSPGQHTQSSLIVEEMNRDNNNNNNINNNNVMN